MISKSLCVAALALFVAACLPSTVSATDADILQFALNLEYLEANFYSCAAYGKPIAKKYWGKGGRAPQGCTKARLSPAALKYAMAITKDEVAHVAFLRSALTAAGATPVSQPLLNIGSAFRAAADAAVNATLSPSFNAYGSDVLFYHAAFIFEDVGVTAYLGAAPLIENKAYLDPAAGILAVEAYHAGQIRTILQNYASVTVNPYGVNASTIITAIANLRDAAAGTNVDGGIYDADGMSTLVPTDSNSIVQPRSAAEVLKIVYLGGTEKGGFFPNGLNGAIKSAA